MDLHLTGLHHLTAITAERRATCASTPARWACGW